MPRGRYNRRIEMPTIPEAQRNRYLQVYPGDALYHTPHLFPRLDSRSLFGSDVPMEMEIGCGTGEFLCTLASRHPAVHYVGIEISPKALRYATEMASSLSLNNLLFLCADFRLAAPLLAPASLRAIYLHFPDPHMQPKYRKHRLFDARFLDTAHMALEQDGLLSVITDVEKFFLEMLETAEADSRFQKRHAERFLTGWDFPVASRFQQTWQAKGLPILRFELLKR
jgi:tRNA (guanine-N7-)-methyltransferase